MFEIHLANWITPCRVIMRTLGEPFGWLFVIYRCVVGFSVMNVIGAVFVQQTMSVAQEDSDIMILQKQRAVERYNAKLRALFKALDQDGDKMLSRTEFESMGKDSSLKAWMGALDINPDDLEGLFDLLDTGDGFISTEEFLCGAQRLKGTAKNIDMAQLLVVSSRVEGNINRISQKLDDEVVVRLDKLENCAPGSRQPRRRFAEPVQDAGAISRVMQGIADLAPDKSSWNPLGRSTST